ncbi:hypothetical protein LMH87_011744 [Akanthomyces muscarius]|uniref:DUF7514 domain-containing protein n=1 Tax=Akanthomyces muscarius TaxID=2231603 RepID=A0A9W8UL32_AKAMU|nr:hypothetical protein LMH87_011744 [Akanthomyces muscarius]KAJ4151024.1 hypothetical protein LMH87_011744 [Akanthomyces muscarius]
MAPGLISTLAPDELREHHRDAPHKGRAVASSTTSSSRAPLESHAVEVEARVTKEASTSADVHETQGAEKVLLLESGFVEQLKSTFAISAVQKRQLDEFLNTCPVTTKPLLARAYSESSLLPRAKETARKEARYQATVEDCTESEDDDNTPTPSCTSKAPTPKDPELDHARLRRHHTYAASAPTSPVAASATATEPLAPAAIPVVKEVRFSDRVPAVLPRSSPVRHTTWSGGTSQPANIHVPREKIHFDERWGVLFNSQGRPTPRMRNVLRGLAIYLTEVYKPTYSLVLTPEKLYKFYSRYRLDREPIDLTRIFGLTSRGAMRSLEDLYADMKCHYHLVKDDPSDPKERACIPALTPDGFVMWTLKLICAYPDQEAARLARVIADVPLDAVSEDPSLECEGQRTRLPRQISRHLFPAEPDPDVLHLVTRAVRSWKHDTPGSDRPPPPSPPLPHATSCTGGGRIAQVIVQSHSALPPPLIHSDARSRQEHLNRCRRDYESEVEIVVPGARNPDREGCRSSRYTRVHTRQESPRRSSKRYTRRSGDKESERDRRRGDRRWSDDGYEESRCRRREGRGSRA